MVRLILTVVINLTEYEYKKKWKRNMKNEIEYICAKAKIINANSVPMVETFKNAEEFEKALQESLNIWK